MMNTTTITALAAPLPPIYTYVVSSVFTLLALVAAYIWGSRATLLDGFELALGPKDGVSPKQAQIEFKQRAIPILTNGVEKFRHGPFQVFTEAGTLLVLPSSKYFGEIKSDPRFGVYESNRKVFMTDIPGFEGLHAITNDRLLKDVVRTNLKTGLVQLNAPLVDELNFAADIVLGQPTEWKSLALFQPCMEIVARISSRVFLDKPLCRDPRWLKVSVDYTFLAFNGTRVLRFWPERLRPMVHWFLPELRQLRACIRTAQELLKPVLGDMKKEWEEMQSSGDKKPSTNVIHMILDVAMKIGYPIDKIDFVVSQLGLSAAAVHTTTDMVVQTMFEICCHPEYLAPLREEIEALLATNGGVLDSNTKLNTLRFMDSFMKEVQRVKPVAVTNSKRVTSADVTLSDGTFVPKGTYLTLFDDARMDPNIFPDPERFDPYRSLREREKPGRENMHQFVTTAPESIGFGHGIHACTGRFLANNEIKLMLCHFLMNYDWKLPEGAPRPEPLILGPELIVNPTAELMYKKRVR